MRSGRGTVRGLTKKACHAAQVSAQSWNGIPAYHVKILSVILATLSILLQYPLWLGKGGWLKVWEVDRQIATQDNINKRLQARNATLDAEVRDLKQGYEAIEERARNELGMIKEDEVFFHVLEENDKNIRR